MDKSKNLVASVIVFFWTGVVVVEAVGILWKWGVLLQMGKSVVTI